MNNSVNISDESNTPEFIRDSWLRCGKMMQRDFWAQPHRAQGLTFDSICRRKTAMLTLGQAALEDAWEYMAPESVRCLFWMRVRVY